MAAPTYASDLVDINLGTGTWVEMTGASAGRTLAEETDYYIEGDRCISQIMNAVGMSSQCFDATSIAVASGKAVFFWLYWTAPTALATRAAGGFGPVIGSGLGDYKVWYALGSDNYQYGGWVCIPVDPTVAASFTAGSPTSTLRYFGSRANVPTTAVAKGNPHGTDAMRHGREFRIYAGDSGSPASFTGAAAWNDNQNRRWGLFQDVGGSFLHQGLFVMGYSAACYFVGTNQAITIPDTLFVGSAFHGYEVRNASSYVKWEAISIRALSSIAKGTFTVIDDATVLLTSCSFTNMGIFTLLPNTTADGCTWRGCGQIISGGATLIRSQISGYEGAADSSALVWNVNDSGAGKLDNMTFKKGTASTHAIEFGTTAPTTINLSGITFSGYNASNGQTDSAIYIARTSGTVTINCAGVTGTVSYKSAGATVIISNAVTITLTGLVNPTEVRVYTRDGSGNNDTLIDGVEDVVTGSWAFSYTASEAVNIVIYSIGYLPADIYNYTIPSLAASLPVKQVIDRQYDNP